MGWQLATGRTVACDDMLVTLCYIVCNQFLDAAIITQLACNWQCEIVVALLSTGCQAHLCGEATPCCVTCLRNACSRVLACQCSVVRPQHNRHDGYVTDAHALRKVLGGSNHRIALAERVDAVAREQSGYMAFSCNEVSADLVV